jgi:aryl-alcohol dehydrogenase-like predicted oxidoreductase
LTFKKKLILGAAQFSGSYGFDKVQNTLAKREIKKIFKCMKYNNMDFLDTSLEYNNVNKKIRLYKTKKLKLITKIKFKNDYLENKNEKQIKDIIIKRLFSSKKEINIKHFHSLLIHNFEMLELNNQKKLFDILLQLKKNKELSKIGFSIYDFKKLKITLKKFKPDIIQCPYNIFDRRLNDIGLKKIIRKKKISVHVRSIFLQGLLLLDPVNLPKKFLKWKSKFKKWHDWSKKKDIKKIDAIFSFLKDNKDIDKIIFGVQNFRQLKEVLSLRIKKTKIPSYLTSNDKNLISPNLW